MVLEIQSTVLPEQSAQMTREGILFNGFLYSNSTLIKEQWYEKVLRCGPWALQVYFDPSCSDFILVPHEDYGLMIVYSIQPVTARDSNDGLLQEYYCKLQALKKLRKRKRKGKRFDRKT